MVEDDGEWRKRVDAGLRALALEAQLRRKQLRKFGLLKQTKDVGMAKTTDDTSIVQRIQAIDVRVAALLAEIAALNSRVAFLNGILAVITNETSAMEATLDKLLAEETYPQTTNVKVATS